MPFEKPILQTSDPYKNINSVVNVTRTIYYGEVVSIDDDTDGGRIRVKIPDLDNKTPNIDLPWCYPLLPKFFHVFPKVGEMVRIFIEDIKYPQRSRFWMGSIISQPQKFKFDSIYTALSTTNMGLTNPEAAPTTYPDAEGVYPLKEDVAIVGRVNTDIILRINEVHIRAGKHENDNVLKLNVKNPASLGMVYEIKQDTVDYYSNTIMMSDKIGLISHSGKPQFKAVRLTPEDRIRIFEEGHPIPRGDVLVEALDVLRNAILNHIHAYSNLPADRDAVVAKLESIDFSTILQKNIVIN
jgi:hypothetical protein